MTDLMLVLFADAIRVGAHLVVGVCRWSLRATLGVPLGIPVL